MEEIKTKSFRDLLTWQHSHQLVLRIYRITKNFPSSELHSLTNQIRRAAVSISSNIAESYGRRSSKEKIQFFNMAMGSLTEVENQLIISLDLGYINQLNYEEIMGLIVSTGKLLNKLISTTKSSF